MTMTDTTSLRVQRNADIPCRYVRHRWYPGPRRHDVDEGTEVAGGIHSGT